MDVTDAIDDGALEQRFLGMVEVDSGKLILGDPLYCLPRAAEVGPGIDYEATAAAPDEPASYLAGRPVLLLGRFGGDGTFPVYGDVDEHGELVRVTVEFVVPDDADEGVEQALPESADADAELGAPVSSRPPRAG